MSSEPHHVGAQYESHKKSATKVIAINSINFFLLFCIHQKQNESYVTRRKTIIFQTYIVLVEHEVEEGE